MTAFVSFFPLLLHVELLVYGHSVQMSLWSPETIEVFGCGGESWTEGSTQVVSCCI